MMFNLKSIISLFATLLLILFALGLSGCGDQTIDAFQEQQGPYSIYGALEVGSFSNYVRIRKVDTPLLAEPSDFEGVVTFTDLETGETTELRDTVVEFNGNYTHNFLVEELIRYDRQYLIRVESPDGKVTESIASTPKQTTIELTPNENIRCATTVEFTFKDVVKPEFMRMDMAVNFQGRLHRATLDFVDEIRHRNDVNEMFVELSPNNMLVELFPPPVPDDPFLDPKTLRPTVQCFQIQPRTILMDFYHFGKEWDSALPSALGNLDIESDDIQNGIGFFGGFARQTIVLNIDL